MADQVAAAGGAQSAAQIGPRRPELDGMRMGPMDPQGPSFADTLERALGDVSDLQQNAQDAIGSFLRGEPVELHQVNAAVEEAGIALEMLIEVRNKLADAYRSVVNMNS